MLAYVLTRYGGPDALEIRNVPPPQPGPGDVQIKVAAAGLNPVDYKFRRGVLRRISHVRLPIIAGCELAGTVEAVGAGPSRFAIGDRVYAWVDKTRLGAFAELVACSRNSWPPVRRRWASARGEALVRRLGADRIIDYTRENFAEVLRDFDAVLDLVGGVTLSDSFRILRSGGKVVSVAGVPEPHTARKDLGSPPLIAAAPAKPGPATVTCSCTPAGMSCAP